MNGFLSVFKREFKSYFATPVAYVFLVIFLIAAPFLAFQNGAFFKMGRPVCNRFFNSYLCYLSLWYQVPQCVCGQKNGILAL